MIIEIVTLTWPEVTLGAHVGCMRNIMAQREARIPGANQGLEDTWTGNIDGAIAELAVAKYLGRFWSGHVGEYDQPDVGPYQVRCNGSRKHDDMILRPRDFEKHWDDVFISVLSFLPKYHILGWKLCSDCKREEWYREGTPGRPKAYFVPRTALGPLEQLPPG